jgi:large subunit ribosomal protein L23Ae
MTTKAQQIKQASKTAKASKKGAARRKYTVRYNLRFYKPHTLRLASKPKYEHTRAGLKLPSKLDKHTILYQILSTEKVNKVLTERNTLTFLVNNRANKIQIKKAFKDITNVKPKAVNTLVLTNGKKKAYIRLRPEDSAVDIAAKFGAI